MSFFSLLSFFFFVLYFSSKQKKYKKKWLFLFQLCIWFVFFFCTYYNIFSTFYCFFFLCFRRRKNWDRQGNVIPLIRYLYATFCFWTSTAVYRTHFLDTCKKKRRQKYNRLTLPIFKFFFGKIFQNYFTWSFSFFNNCNNCCNETFDTV